MSAKNTPAMEMGELFSQFLAFVQAQDNAPAKAEPKSPKGTSRGATSRAKKTPAKVKPGMLTMADAWERDERSAGQDRPDWASEVKPASAKQLYALNMQGRLA